MKSTIATLALFALAFSPCVLVKLLPAQKPAVGPGLHVTAKVK